MSRILHLGVGNFHRAHQAWYTHAANAAAREPWIITGVSLRSPGMRDALAPQGFRYTLAIRGPDGTELQDIAVIDDILVAPEDPDRVLDAIADAQVELVTLTVTEKGYHLDTSGALDLAAPAIARDLASALPASTIGLLAHGLARRAGSGAPLTVLSCDNIAGNGAKLRAAVLSFATAADLDIGDYLAAYGAFPSSMVDRITPATDASLRAEVAASGRSDAAPVATEPFTEWVIEDRFAARRPAWEAAGAVFTDDVASHELRKLRMLNGAHSYLAYAGTLAGYEYVHEAIADPALAAGAAALMDEAASTLPAAVQTGAQSYKAALLARFANPAIAHRLRQIAMDGSLKLPIRILSTHTERRERGLPSPACDAALAAWAAFLAQDFTSGRAVDDPDADRLRAGIGAEPDGGGTPAALALLSPQGR